jgi:hypothetical protein
MDAVKPDARRQNSVTGLRRLFSARQSEVKGSMKRHNGFTVSIYRSNKRTSEVGDEREVRGSRRVTAENR